MKILGIDFETQGLEAETTNITEAGYGIFDYAKGEGVSAVSHFVYDNEYPPQAHDVVELTGITDEILKSKGLSPQTVLSDIIERMQGCDYVMAYNAAFDRAVFQSACKRYGLPVPATPWLCAMVDVPYPEKFKCGQLAHRAYDHGILIDPSLLHRAGQDVDLMFMLVSQYPIQEIVEYASQPWVYLRASIPKPWEDGGVGKAKAKARKFTWEQANGDDRKFPSMWVKRVKASKVENELALAKKLGLLVLPINERATK